VARTIQKKNLSQTFATAAQVARNRSGDCTEHAVLTAALCRAHGIPARVATGLVAVNDMYAFHMWNEVWIRDRWVPVDATLGLGGIGAGHIKLGVSSLEGVSPFAALAPVLEVMGSLDLEITAYE
jgi:transglutaminase/protease-like cytokinesis protein 3